MINVSTRIGELKTHSLILARLRQAIASRDFTIFVIFPTLHLLQAVLNEFLNQQNHGFGGRLLLFQGFQDEVCEFLGVRRRLPTPLERELLITQCFRQLIREDKLSYLGQAPFNRHYRQAILEGIAEWSRSGLTPEIFEAWIDGKGVRSGKGGGYRESGRAYQGGRLEELSLLYRRYQELLARKGFASDELILNQIKDMPPPKQKQGSVIVYGFTDLTPLQFKYLDVLTPWFDMEFIIDPTPVPEFQARTFRWVSGFFSRELSTAAEAASPPHTVNALNHLQHHLWVEPFKPWVSNESAAGGCPTGYSPALTGDHSVRLIQSAGSVRTVTDIAREIVGLIAVNPEYRWDDFLIISPEPSSFCRTARPVFQEYGLPLPKTPVLLREIPCINHWLQAVTVVSGNWPWPEMEILIRQSYRENQASLGDRVILEIARQYGALSGRERWLSVTKSDRFRRYFSETGLDIQPLLRKVAWLARVPGAARLHEYLKLSLDWIRDFFFKDEYAQWRLFDSEENYRERVADLRGATFFRDAVKGFFQFIMDLSEFQGIIPVGEFGQFMQDYLLTQEVSEPDTPGYADESGLRVLPPQETRGLTARVVFITGLEQGVFPGVYINDWKINNGERRELNSLGIRLETVEQFQVQEKMAFYWGLQAAKERLYLVVRDQDDNAQPLNRSIFLDEIYKWLPDLSLNVVASSLAPSLPDSFCACRSVPESRQYWAYHLTAGPGTLPEMEQETHRGFLREAGYQALAFQVMQWRERLAGPSSPFFTKPDSWKLLEKIYHPEYTFAITALEEFRKCSYRFYFRHLLKVRPLFRPQLFPSGLDLGDLYHQILQEFGDNYREQSLIWEYQRDYQKYLDECFQSFFREWLENAPNDPVKLVLLIKAKEIQRNLAGWLAAELRQNMLQSGRFRIKYLELAFGLSKGEFDRDSTTQPFSCEFGDQKVSLWGKVDRVDQDLAGNFIVYDYKSGIIPSIQNILKLENLQLPVYIMALEQLYFGAGRAAGGSYLGLRHSARNRSGIWRQLDQSGIENVLAPKIQPLTEAEWQEWLANVRRVLVETAGAVRKGEFGGRAEKCVSFCEYRNLCRRQGGEEGNPLEE
ncbi:MAG: PD-(D/E)XK nuclease family protein [Firmicutes bacterium]|nr:PD-(D/E)XK nuclease family protein [Bacillota bacterium]